MKDESILSYGTVEGGCECDSGPDRYKIDENFKALAQQIERIKAVLYTIDPVIASQVLEDR